MTTPKTSYPKDKIRVLLLERIHPRAEQMFAEEGFRVESSDKALEGEALDRALLGAAGDGGAHVLGIRSQSRLGAPVFANHGPGAFGSGRLIAVGCFCIGTNQVDLRAANLAGVPVFNSPFSNTRSVAELTIAEIVALHRRLLDKSVQMHRGEWDKSAAGAHEVRGRTLGIVGYGRIGSQVSVLAEAMGMRVLFHDIAPCLPLGNARRVRTLDELLAQSDVVTLHVPATRQTEGLIGSRQLAMMKPGGYLINNARGGVVDLAAAGEALRSGRLAGAALDVFPEEPSKNGEVFRSPVCGLSNVILTPHIGGSTEEAQESIAADVAAKLIRFVNNGSTTTSVNVPQVELPEQGFAEPSAAEPALAEAVRNGAGGGSGGSGGGRRHRILHFHRNVPGVLRQMHEVIAQTGANVAAEYLQTNAEVGYVVLDVDPTDAGPILDRLRAIPETIRLRMLW